MLQTIVWAARRSVRETLAATRAMRRRTARAIRDRLAVRRGATAAKMRGLLRCQGGGGPTDGPPPGETLHGQVLEILAAHHDGIRVREIGNELGIDWRGLAPVMSGLVARGLADQIEQDFYPTAKASRKC